MKKMSYYEALRIKNEWGRAERLFLDAWDCYLFCNKVFALIREENSKTDSIGVGVFINERMNEESVRCGKALLECYKRAKAVVAIFEEIGEAENIVKAGTLEHAYSIIQENDWRFKNL
jgi:hypothetical protein